MNIIRILCLIGLLILGLMQGGTIIGTGIFVGVLTFVSLAALYLQLSFTLKKFVIRYRGFIDVFLSITLLGMLGISTATGLIASTTAGLLMTLGFYTEYVRMSNTGELSSEVKDLFRD